MGNTLFSGVDISQDEAVRTQWYAIWSAGIPKKGNLHNWFVYHAEKDDDILSNSYILHEYYELEELQRLGCSPFDVDSLSLKRLANKDGFKDVRVYLKYLNDIHIILINQKVAQASHDYEYSIAHDYALLKQLGYLKKEAYKKGYDVTLSALAATMPFANDRGEFSDQSTKDTQADTTTCFLTPTEQQLRVVRQFWSRLNDQASYNILSRTYSKRFSSIVNPVIRNIYDVLMGG